MGVGRDYLSFNTYMSCMTEDLSATDVMTEGVIAIEKDATVQEAAALMQDEDIRSLVVLDEDEAVGIVVGRDIVYEVTRNGHDVTSTTVEDIMSRDLVTAVEHDSVSDIARAMMEHDISRVPVLAGDQVVGIVTQSNIIRAWPAYIDLMREENEMFPVDTNRSVVETLEGECDQCENYSDEIIVVDGAFLCPVCRAEM